MVHFPWLIIMAVASKADVSNSMNPSLWGVRCSSCQHLRSATASSVWVVPIGTAHTCRLD